MAELAARVNGEADTRKHLPFVVRGYAQHAEWPAVGVAALEAVQRGLAEVMVPVEVGATYMDSETVNVPGGLYCELLLAQIGDTSADGEEGAASSQSTPTYLAQVPLFEPHYGGQALRKALVRSPPPAVAKFGVFRECAWVGPGQTVTPTHRDPQPNLLVQLLGKKNVLLWAPSAGAAMRPAAFPQHNTSTLDPEAAPESLPADFAAQVRHTCTLGEGDLLFIPKGWWHHVRAVDVSVSVNFWLEEECSLPDPTLAPTQD